MKQNKIRKESETQTTNGTTVIQKGDAYRPSIKLFFFFFYVRVDLKKEPVTLGVGVFFV